MKRILFAAVAALALVCVSCNNDDDNQSEEQKKEFVTRELPAAVENTNPRLLIKTAEQEATLKSLTRVDSLGELYRMDYTADYGLTQLLAAGGVTSNTELLGYAQRYLLNYPAGARDLAHDFGCSSFLVKDEDGHYLFCRNFDYVIESPISVITRTKGTIGTFCMNMAIASAISGSADNGVSDNSFYVAAPLAMMDGMNEYGVAISVLVVKSYGAEQHAEGKSNITTTAVMREILDNAKDIDEALAIFDSHNFYAHGGNWQSNYHFFIADATGRSVVVEYINSGRDNQEDKDYHKVVTESPYATNNFLCTEFREPLSDTRREAMIAERIDEVTTKADAFKLLLDVSQVYNKETESSTIFGEATGANTYPETLWSLVYDLTDKTTYILSGRDLMEGKAPFKVSMMN